MINCIDKIHNKIKEDKQENYQELSNLNQDYW